MSVCVFRLLVKMLNYHFCQLSPSARLWHRFSRALQPPVAAGLVRINAYFLPETFLIYTL